MELEGKFALSKNLQDKCIMAKLLPRVAPATHRPTTVTSHDECKKKRFALEWSGVEEAAVLQMN